MNTNISRKKISTVAGLILMAGVLAVSQKAYAVTPTIAAALTGSGDNVSLNITGDPNSSVILNYLNNSAAVQMSALGVTNSSGSFSVTVSTAVYGIAPNSLFSVTVNSQKSSSAVWPYAATSTAAGTSLSLSQTSASLSIGQSATITAYNNNTSVLYLSGNSSPSVANVSINGNQFTVSANTSGSTTVTVCSVANSSNCASVSVTVPSANVQQITFSQSSVSVAYGQNMTVSIAGGTGIYSVVSNSNPSVIQAAISGSSLNLYANSSSGSATLTICSSDMSSCGIVSVTAAGPSGSSALSFSQSNPTITIGQLIPVTVSGSSGSYYISSNSNTSAVQANLVGATLSLYGNSSGSSILTVCASGGGCGTVSAAVVVPGATSITLAPSSATLSVNQVFDVSISGAGGYYISTNSSSSVASATINGSTLVVTALSVGAANITVCQTGGQCAITYITVSSGSSSLILSPSSVTLTPGQTSGVAISGIGGYYISGNSNTSVASAVVSGNSVSVTAVNIGTANITVCQSNSQCAMLYVTVNSSVQSASASPLTISEVISVGQGINLMVSGGSAPYTLSSNPGTIFTSNLSNGSVLTLVGIKAGISSVNVCSANGGCATVNVVVVNPAAAATANTAANLSESSHKFNNLLKLGSSGTDVTALQNRLTSEGVYSGPISGYYGSLTRAAVEKYQEEHRIANSGITGYGEVGPHTRASLNGN